MGALEERRCESLFYFILFILFIFFVFLGLHPLHMEVSRLGVELEL